MEDHQKAVSQRDREDGGWSRRSSGKGWITKCEKLAKVDKTTKIDKAAKFGKITQAAKVIKV